MRNLVYSFITVLIITAIFVFLWAVWKFIFFIFGVDDASYWSFYMAVGGFLGLIFIHGATVE